MTAVYEATEIEPGACEIEITESTLQHEENCVGVLEQLKARGVHIAIDDFGTGYSCLSSLKLLPISKLKIDKSFVNDLVSDEDDLAIVQAVIAIAHKLGMVVVAEGVETEEQANLLRDNGCDIAQGYFFHKPMPLDQVNQLLGLNVGVE